MSFHVVWKTAARDELAEAWLASPSPIRKAITVACHSLENQLRSNPFEVGESRDGNERIAFERPLVVLFDIDELRRLVRVLNVSVR